jgi:uncharacterized phage-associated protein
VGQFELLTVDVKMEWDGGAKMRLVFNERKAAQAAAHLLKLNGGTMRYMVLIKLLYFADKESLIRTGYTITGDQMFSMRNGPVLSAVLDLVHMGKPEEPSSWFEYISENQGYDVSLVKALPDEDELSAYEISVLDAIHERWGRVEPWTLVKLTHTLPEWRDPGRSVCDIEAETLLRLAGKSQEDIERIVADAEETWLISQLQGATL